MNEIRVTQDGKLFKVMVNFIQRAVYQSHLIANKEAEDFHKKWMPTYKLIPFIPS